MSFLRFLAADDAENHDDNDDDGGGEGAPEPNEAILRRVFVTVVCVAALRTTTFIVRAPAVQFAILPAT